MSTIIWKKGVCDMCNKRKPKTTTIRDSTYCATVCQACYGVKERNQFSPCYNPLNETGKCTLLDAIVEQLIGAGCQKSRCSNCTIAHKAAEILNAGGSLDNIHKNPLLKKKVKSHG